MSIIPNQAVLNSHTKLHAFLIISRNIGNSLLGLLHISKNLPQFPLTDFVKLAYHSQNGNEGNDLDMTFTRMAEEGIYLIDLADYFRPALF